MADASLNMSLDELIEKNKKSGGGDGANRRGGRVGRGSGPGPTRRFNNNRGAHRATPYGGPKGGDVAWRNDMYVDQGIGGGGGRASAMETGTKLYISNLDYGVSNEDIKELFAEVGDLKKYSIHYDRSGISKGTAEIVYSRKQDALAAVKRYNNVQLDGKPMKIEIVGLNLVAPVPPMANNYNGNMNSFPRGGQARNAGFGRPRGGANGGAGRGFARGRGRGRGGRGEKISGGDVAWRNDMYVDQGIGRASAMETGTKLYISNLDYGVSNEDIKELFAEVGDLKKYSIHYDRSGRSKGTAEIMYSRKQDALAAVKRYNNVQLDGKPMKIEIVGLNLVAPIPPMANNYNGNMNSFPRGGQARNAGFGRPRGGANGGAGRGFARGRGRGRGGRGEKISISADDLDADLEKYHSESMQTN